MKTPQIHTVEELFDIDNPDQNIQVIKVADLTDRQKAYLGLIPNKKPDLDWIETHHEIVSEISISLYKDEESNFSKRREEQGTGGIWELAEDLTNEFETLHKGREWDGEFYDELEAFIESKKYNNK